MPYDKSKRRASYLREMADPVRRERLLVRTRAAQKRHYIRNKPERIAKQQSKRQETRAMIAEYKDRPCLDCGISYPSYVMDLDHVTGTKITNLGSGFLNTSFRLTIEEALKCEPVCANCHREREHQKRQKQKQESTSLKLTTETKEIAIAELATVLRPTAKAHLDALLSTYASLKFDRDALTHQMDIEQAAIGKILEEHDITKASTDEYHLFWSRGKTTKKLLVTKLIALGVTKAQIDAASPEKPKRDFFQIRAKGSTDNSHSDDE